MNIEQLQYITEITKTGSISNAAESLHISQAAISKAISNLEEELNIVIFNRTRSGTIPTDGSKQLIRKAFEIIEKIEEFKEEAQIQNSMINGDLKFSSIPSFFMTILPRTLSIFIKEYPDVNLQMTEKEGFEIINQVRQNEIDFGLISMFDTSWDEKEELYFDVLLEGKVQVYVSKNSPLAYYDTVTPTDLRGQTLVTYNGSFISSFINDYFNKHGKMKILFTSNNTEVIKNTVAEGLAIYFNFNLGQKYHPHVASGNIVPLNLIGHDRTNIVYGAIRSKKKYFSTAARAFLKQLKKQTQDDSY